MTDFEVSISKTLSIRGKEWQTLKCQYVKHFLLEVRKVFYLLTFQSLSFLTSNRKCFIY
jgi:hypothetical protein